MGNLYSAKLHDGTLYDVTTDKHHDNHTDADFKRHLFDIIKSSVAGVISGSVVHFLHKGRK